MDGERKLGAPPDNWAHRYPGDRTVHYARGEREIALAIHTVAGDTFEFFDDDAIGLALILAVDMG